MARFGLWGECKMTTTGNMSIVVNIHNDDSRVFGNDGASFVFKAIAPLGNIKSQPISTFSLFDDDPSQMSQYRFGGAGESVTFSFALFNNGEDMANYSGTTRTFIDGPEDAPVWTETFTTVITLSQQIRYLRDVIFDSNANTTWTLYDGTGRFYETDKPITGFIQELKFDNAAGSVAVVTGQFTFVRGRILSLASIFG